MSPQPAHLEHARQVADAVLYEGYVLYPYRRSAQKNRTRFQFGVLMPPPYRAVDECEPSVSQTECLAECPDDAEVDVVVRFLHLQRRSMREAGGAREVDSVWVDETEHTSWDEAVEREEHLRVPVAGLLAAETARLFRIGPSEETEELLDRQGKLAARVVRRCQRIDGAVRLRAERTGGPCQALRLQVRVENLSYPAACLRRREDGLRYALVATHALIAVDGGTFLSLTDPPEWAAAQTAACTNIGTWPVLAGPEECRDLVLSSPVILYDHPEVAGESAGNLFDATEIDEILTLRTLALTDDERREARATDPRTADLIDRLDGLSPQMLERLHGAIRYLAPASPPSAGGASTATPGAAPWWDPGADSSVSPETDHVMVAGVKVARGSLVTMRPGQRRADAQDLFLAGREAVVEAVLQDVDGHVHLAVSPVSDPLAELQRGHGRFLYFAPDEIQPVGAAEAARDGQHTPEGERS